jgi:signal transduction histidine kinase
MINNHYTPYKPTAFHHSFLLNKWRIATSLFILFFTASIPGYSQEPDSMTIDVAKLRFSEIINEKCWFSAQPRGLVPATAIPSLPYSNKEVRKYHGKAVLDSLMEKDLYLKFVLYNSADTAKNIYLLPAFYCTTISLFRATPGDVPASFQAIPDSSIKKGAYAGVRLLRIEPHEKVVFFCRFNLLRSNVNGFATRIIEEDFLDQWLVITKNKDWALDLCTYVVSGILLLMVFYSLAIYLQNHNKEFLYYAVYTLCTVLLLFLKSFLNVSANWFNFFYEEYLDFMILSGSVFSYLIFVRKFINTRENHPQLDKFLRWADWILLGLFCVFSMIYFFTDRYIILSLMENLVIKIFFFIIGVIFIIYSLKKKDTLLNYLAAGNFALIVFSVLSFGIIVYKWEFVSKDEYPLFNRALLYYEIGLVLELGFFLSGLAYKNRRDIIDRVKERERLKLDNERKEFEKQMAVVTAKQEERDRISADMHDELGSGVTAIRLMSEIMKSKMRDQTFPELEKISSSANDLLGKMNAIIWTMKSSNDTIESLIAYIRAHAIEYFDSTPIDCTVCLPPVIPQADMSGEKRRNIFLSVKEALNNAMKHSQANHIQVDIAIKNNHLVIQVMDNGVGIDPEKLRRFGNGLSNMRRRMESISGSFRIENNGCCTLIFEAPI